MIQAIEINLQRGIRLLQSITNQQYVDTSVAPYFSSIGSHIRHVLDMFDCIFEGYEKKSVDFSARKRNVLVEQSKEEGIAYFNIILSKLNTFSTKDLSVLIKVTDDLGLGRVTTDYILSSTLIQAHSHAIHHYASIAYIISQLGIELPDSDFGFNPTTPKKALTL